jgi:hypothetical protein
VSPEIAVLNAHIWPGVTAKYSPPTRGLIFMLDDATVAATDVPSPICNQPWTSATTRIWNVSGVKFVLGTEVALPP